VLGLGAEMGGLLQLQPLPLAELCRQRVDGKWNWLHIYFGSSRRASVLPLLSSSLPFREVVNT